MSESKPKRFHVSVRRETHALIKQYCEAQGITMGKFVELLAERYIPDTCSECGESVKGKTVHWMVTMPRCRLCHIKRVTQ